MLCRVASYAFVIFLCVGGFLFVYLNEYGSLVTAFVLQAPPVETSKWIHNIEKAKVICRLCLYVYNYCFHFC